MQISNIVTAYVNSLQRNSLCQVCAFCLCMCLLPVRALVCVCLCVFVCVRLVMPVQHPPLSVLRKAVWGCTQARLGVCLWAALLVHLCCYVCVSAVESLCSHPPTTPTRRAPLSATECRGFGTQLPTGRVKDLEVKDDGEEGVVYNMWVYVTAAVVITAL